RGHYTLLIRLAAGDVRDSRDRRVAVWLRLYVFVRERTKRVANVCPASLLAGLTGLAGPEADGPLVVCGHGSLNPFRGFLRHARRTAFGPSCGPDRLCGTGSCRRSAGL